MSGVDLNELKRWLRQDYPRCKVTEEKVYEVECPACGRKKAYMFWSKPYGLKCPSDHCGEVSKIQDLYPDLCNPERHAPTADCPNLPARVFLQNRGLSTDLINRLEKNGKFRHLENARKLGVGAIGFPVINGKGESVLNGRLYMPPPGEDKGHNVGSTAGGMWTPPDIDPNKAMFCVEGVIDAMSLIQEGYQALSYLSAQNRTDYTSLYRQFPNKKFILAPDNDAAGKASVKRQVEQLTKAGVKGSAIEVIAPPKGQDWNDLLRAGSLKKYLTSRSPSQEGALLQASTAQEWAELKFSFSDSVPSIFVFDGKTYGAWLKTAKGKSDEDPSVSTKLICSAELLILETMVEEHQGEKRFAYRIEIREKKKKPEVINLKAEDLVGPKELRKALMRKGNLMYHPGTLHDAFVIWLMHGKDRRLVREMVHHGRDPELGAFLSQQYGVLGDKVLKPDAQGSFCIKGAFLLPKKSNRKPIELVPCPEPEVYQLLTRCYGDVGKIALSWVVATWMKSHFMLQYGFFPFLSLYGEASTGKSTLGLALSRTRGLDFEGHPLNQHLATPKGMQRVLSQYSDTHVTLIEGRNGHLCIDMDIFLSAFNNCDIYLRAQCTQGNETSSEPFLGAIMFVQNVELFIGEPQKSRAISVPFEQRSYSPDDIKAFQQFERMKAGCFACMGVSIMLKLDEIQKEWFAEYDKILPQMKARFKNQRIAQTHACVLAAYRATFNKVLKWDSADLEPFVMELAEKKREDCKRLENSLVQVFIERLVDFLDHQAESSYGRVIVEGSEPAFALSNNIWRNPDFKIPDREKGGILTSLNQMGYYLTSKPVRFSSTDNPERAWVLKLKPLLDAGLNLDGGQD